MRTTLDLPAPLLDEAQRILGYKSKTDTVVLSLTELVRRHRIDELKSLAGRVDLGIDLARSRRRPGARRVRPAKEPRPHRAHGRTLPLAKP
jgi:Arc/MetJ family transcription regulator